MVVGVGAVWVFLCDCNMDVVKDVVVDLSVGTVVSSFVTRVPSADFEGGEWCVVWLWVGFDRSSFCVACSVSELWFWIRVVGLEGAVGYVVCDMWVLL